MMDLHFHAAKRGEEIKQTVPHDVCMRQITMGFIRETLLYHRETIGLTILKGVVFVHCNFQHQFLSVNGLINKTKCF